MTLTARHYDSAADMLASAHAVRMRLMYPKNALRPVSPSPVIMPAEGSELEQPLWRKEETRFEAHMADYRRHLFNQARKIDAYIEKRAVELGFTYDEMVGARRFRRLTFARQIIWWEIKSSVKPDATWKELGRAMGNKDHSSPFVAFHKIEALRAKGQFNA